MRACQDIAWGNVIDGVNLHASRLLWRGAAAPPVGPLVKLRRVGDTASGEKAAAIERKRRAARTDRRGCMVG